MQNLPYLVAAYLIIWAAIFGYVMSLVSRHRALRREVESLRRAMADRVEESGSDIPE